MFRNYFFINIILILIVSFLGLRFYKALIYKKDNPVNITVTKAGPENIKAVSEDKGIDKESLKVITEKDIFRSSRTSSLAVTNVMPPQNPPTLFGTIIVGVEKTALLKEDAGNTARMYRLNESVSGYLIVDIQDDKVLLSAGGQTIVVKLRGKKGANMPQFNPGMPVQGATGRRVRPNPQRPSRNSTNIITPAPAPVPEPFPIPEHLESEVESPDGIQQ